MYTPVTTTEVEIQNICIAPKPSLVPLCRQYPQTWPPATIDPLSVRIVLPFVEFHVNKIMQYVFCTQLFHRESYVLFLETMTRVFFFFNEGEIHMS